MARFLKKRVRDRGKRRGLAIVEAALVFPLILLLTFGLLEYGWMFLKSQHITNAARQGARIGARPDATNGDVSAEVSSIMNAAGIPDGEYTLSFSPSDVESPAAGEVLTVTVTVPYSNIRLTGAGFIPVPSNLEAAISMAKEGP